MLNVKDHYFLNGDNSIKNSNINTKSDNEEVVDPMTKESLNDINRVILP